MKKNYSVPYAKIITIYSHIHESKYSYNTYTFMHVDMTFAHYIHYLTYLLDT